MMRTIRQRAKLSQRELAAKINEDSTVLSMKERERRFDDLSLGYIRSVVEACGGSMKVLIVINNTISVL